MKAHRMAIVIPESREVAVKLPSDFPSGPAELIILVAEEGELRRRLSVDEFLAARLTPPPGAGHVSLADNRGQGMDAHRPPDELHIADDFDAPLPAEIQRHFDGEDDEQP
jgi:hypothetical protein